MDRRTARLVPLGLVTLAGLLMASPVPGKDARQKAPAAHAEAPDSPPARLEVTVLDEAGEPVEGAIVVARPASGGLLPFGGLDPETLRASVAGPGGRATLESLSPGPWTVVVQARGFAPQTKRRVAAGPLEVRLDKGGVISGVVADAEGVPLADARVSLDTALPLPSAWAAEASRVETSTDAEGRFRLNGIGARPVRVVARAPGFGRATRDGVEAGSHVELFLFPGATLSGTVVDQKGRPIEGALVQAAGGGLWTLPPPSERTDAAGGFVMAGVVEGEYIVMARESGRAPGLGRVVVEDEDEALVEIVMTEGGFVTGRVVDSHGEPLAGRSRAVTFEGLGLPDFSRDRFSADARADGAFVLGPLPVGAFEVAVSAPGHGTTRLDALVAAAGATVDLGDVLLDRGLAIRGRVVDDAGAGVADVTVRALAQSARFQTWPETRSRRDGWFEVSGLDEGPYEVVASSPGFAEARATAQAGDEGVELAIEASGDITGRLVDANGRPVDEARITGATTDDSEPGRTRFVHGTVEGEDGRFVLHDVKPATYVLQAQTNGRGEASVPGVRVVAGGATDVGTMRLDRGGAIRGIVVDGDGRGVPGATVDAERDLRSRTGRLRTQTGSNGDFEVRGAPAGRLAVFAHHPAFAPGAAVVVEVDPGSEPEPVRLMLMRGARIEGVALHRDGRPFDGGRVVTWALGSDRVPGASQNGAIGPDGWFALDHVASGRTQVNLMAWTPSSPLVSGPGPNILSGVASQTLELWDGETVTVDFQLRDVVVAGQVTRGGRPAPLIRLAMMGEHSSVFTFAGPTAPRAITAASGPLPLAATTGEDGRYELLVYTPGRFHAQMEDLAGGQAYPGREVDVPDVEVLELNLEIADSVISGVLVGAETGEPVREGAVRLGKAEPDGGWAGGGPAGPDGRFALPVEPGNYRLTAQAPGRRAVHMDVSVGPEGLDDVRIEMEPGQHVNGRIIDASSRPVGGVSVSASDAEGRWSGSTRSLPDGTFRLGGLDDRPHTLVAGTPLSGFAIRPGVRADDEPLTLMLEPGGRVAVRVLDSVGQPVSDVWPRIRAVGELRLSAPGLQSGTTNSAGVVEFPTPAGAVEVEVRTETHTGAGSANVRAGETSPLTIVLEPSSTP